MPQERKKEHKCSHHAPSTTDSLSWWQKFHFSGKVIMCSVLFGLGLVLIGGLILAIGADRHDEEHNGNLNEVQNKAPMTIVGPIIMGIGSFTVFTGIIMCLFETNICRKRQPDARPLIDEQSSEAASRNADATSIPSTSQKREKHRHHKKSSSPRKHKAVKKSEQNSNRSSPSSMPIDMQRSLSRDLTASDKFLTPPSSLVNEHQNIQPTRSDAENQTSASLLKSFTSSGKSWTTSTEFQTPASSLQNSPGSFEGRNETLGISPEPKELSNDGLKSLKHEFVTPKNSSAEIIDNESSSLQETALTNSPQAHSDGNMKSKEFIEEIPEKLDVLNHDFVTPMNSYVDQPNIITPKRDITKENDPGIATKIEAENFAKKSSKEKDSAKSFDYSVRETDAREETRTEESEQEKHTLNDESVFKNTNDFESKEKISRDLKETTGIPDPTSTTENNSNNGDNVVS